MVQLLRKVLPEFDIMLYTVFQSGWDSRSHIIETVCLLKMCNDGQTHLWAAASDWTDQNIQFAIVPEMCACILVKHGAHSFMSGCYNVSKTVLTWDSADFLMSVSASMVKQ